MSKKGNQSKTPKQTWNTPKVDKEEEQFNLFGVFSDEKVESPITVQNSYSEDEPHAVLIRIPPFSYIHVLNTNNNVTRLEVGPLSLTCLDHEKVVLGPAKMVVVPPRHYCIISNPAIVDERGVTVADKYGQVKLRHGDSEIRLSQDPFPLYPGENLIGVHPLRVIEDLSALRLRAIRDFTDRFTKDRQGKPLKRKAGDEWLYAGPGTYIPQVEVEILEAIAATIVGPNQALRLKARKEFTDRNGIVRKAGEEWLVRTEGAYLPDSDEIVIKTVNAHILEKNKLALHLRASKTFTDDFGKERLAGEEWLVTYDDHEMHIPHVYEEVVKEVKAITLTNREYVIIYDPIGPNGKPQLGQRKIVRGEANFFLYPGESIDTAGILKGFILAPEEALLVRARENFRDVTGGIQKDRKAGDRWYICGPGEYFPPIQAVVFDRRKALLRIEPLGIYMFYSITSLVLSVILIILILFVFFGMM